MNNEKIAVMLLDLLDRVMKLEGYSDLSTNWPAEWEKYLKWLDGQVGAPQVAVRSDEYNAALRSIMETHETP
jgi:hypothetical protein